MPSHTLVFHIAGILQLLLSVKSQHMSDSPRNGAEQQWVQNGLRPLTPHTAASMLQVEFYNNEGNENPLRLIQAGTVFQRNPHHNRLHASEALVSFRLPKHSYLILNLWHTVPFVWMTSTCGSSSPVRCPTYKPHAEILTSSWPLGNPDGCFLIRIKKTYEP